MVIVHRDIKPYNTLVGLRWDREQPASRVEDAINLPGRVSRKAVDCAADLLGWIRQRVAHEVGVPVFLESSVEKGSISSTSC